MTSTGPPLSSPSTTEPASPTAAPPTASRSGPPSSFTRPPATPTSPAQGICWPIRESARPCCASPRRPGSVRPSRPGRYARAGMAPWCCAGLAYCVALAGFGAPRDGDLLSAYLDRYLRRPDLAYDQTVAMGALVFLDLNLGGGQTARFLGPDGLWEQWLHDAPHMQRTADPATYLSLIRRLCAFVDDCAETR
ncbi:DUF6000 family protein [Streptomyces sp. NPDC059957]|uniref:DUF6000 family protein n=1 Tax=unclassified Streptomyces TaxID=2593676 RepID=UPI00365F9C57